MGHKLEGVNEKERAVLSSTVMLWKAYTSMDCPTILDPLILGCLLDDMPRVAWMVLKCGGNLKRILAQGTSEHSSQLPHLTIIYICVIFRVCI